MSRFLDSSWHRVAELKPRLSHHVQVQRHRYRGRPWYVLTDVNSGRTHRLTPTAFKLLDGMDGVRTMEQVWQQAVQQLGAEAPGQTDMIHLLGQLHANDLLVCDVAPDSAELFARFNKQSRGLLWKNLRNPLSIRIPLYDPDRFLRATLPLVKPLFSFWGLIVWAAWLIVGALLAAQHWTVLTENIADRIFSTDNLVMMWFIFPLVKVLHELGHAYAVRVRGGEVHEMGIMIMIGMVVPYVDAGASSGFRNKWHRALVGAAGMMVELALASSAMVLWTLLEPGAIRSGLYNVMIIASVSTLIFNGNPLMRYDGYYIFADLIEIPNLAARGPQYWRHLVNRHVFGVLKPATFDADQGERRWFLVFTPLSYVYRLTVMMGIAVYLAEKLLLIGLLLGLWYAYSLVVLPGYKAAVYVLTDPNLGATRRRAVTISGAFVLVSMILIGLVPLPLRTQFEGVVWRPAQAEVRAGRSGFVRRIVVPSGSRVAPGDVLVESEDPELQAQIAVYRAHVEEIKARRLTEWKANRNQAEITREELIQAEAELNRALARADKLQIRSNIGGRFFMDREADLPGRFLHQGDMLGFVVNRSRDIVRIIVPQDDIDLVRRDADSIQVRLAENPDRLIPARLLREVPAADTELPSLALATEGGGKQELDPREQSHSKALNRLFQFDLILAQTSDGDDKGRPSAVLPYGTRAHVRFIHRPESLAHQAWRRIRQLFLSRLGV
ncbi:hypothetical protein [Methylomicrobium lacus]|uniref:hypothetical protein n=1 Tax=Methylomicrobium lacus TaxID=136992 RepID=UPI0035A96D9C